MFCTQCGTRCADNSTACSNCGAPIVADQPVQPAQPVRPAQPVQPAQPTQPVQPVQPAQPVYNAGNQPGYQPTYAQQYARRVTVAPATARQKKLALVIAFLSIFALIMGVMHTFSMVDLPVSVSVEAESDNGQVELDIDESVEVADLPVGLLANVFDFASDFEDELEDYVQYSMNSKVRMSVASFDMGYVGLVIFGLANLAIAAVGILFYMRARNNSPLYHQVCPFIKTESPLYFMAFVGVVAFAVEWLCMFCVSAELRYGDAELGLSVGLSDESWLCLLVYGAILAYGLLIIKDEKTEEKA